MQLNVCKTIVQWCGELFCGFLGGIAAAVGLCLFVFKMYYGQQSRRLYGAPGFRACYGPCSLHQCRPYCPDYETTKLH